MFSLLQLLMVFLLEETQRDTGKLWSNEGVFHMNEEKLNEVSALTEVDSKDITKNKIGKKIVLVYYYLIQLGFLAISGFIGLLFGLTGQMGKILYTSLKLKVLGKKLLKRQLLVKNLHLL